MQQIWTNIILLFSYFLNSSTVHNTQTKDNLTWNVKNLVYVEINRETEIKH